MSGETVWPRLTAYESMLLILSALVTRGKTILRQDTLVPKLYPFSDKENTSLLFDDIAFKHRCDSTTSIDVEDSLNMLQTYGAIGRLNPSYEKIIVYINQEEAEDFIKSFDKPFVEAAQQISEAFDDENS